ncbi:uncharacterized protein LOC128476864 [Spea bombifrons]|uniref:uncharacterized protein LOC128476864 n=1 Tax=Spea bombifrons TaxID=233779 RepID=UPI002348FC46|nr:uncharacterized protein LOC128476864 [Spea bombifrons]
MCPGLSAALCLVLIPMVPIVIADITGILNEAVRLEGISCSNMVDVWFLGKDNKTKTHVVYSDISGKSHVHSPYTTLIELLGNGSFTLGPLSREHEGCYMFECNGSPMVYENLRVVDPVGNVSVVQVSDGLYCNFTGYSVSVSWFTNKQPVTDGSRMRDGNRTLAVPLNETSAEYECQVTDAMNRTHRSPEVRTQDPERHHWALLGAAVVTLLILVFCVCKIRKPVEDNAGTSPALPAPERGYPLN